MIENIHDYGLRRQGLVWTHLHLKEMTERAETIVSNPSQRYKLLKYCIERLLLSDVQEMVLEGEEELLFAFRFEKGKLFVKEVRK